MMSSPEPTDPLIIASESDFDSGSNSDELLNDPIRRSRNRYAKEGYEIVHNNNDSLPKKPGLEGASVR